MSRIALVVMICCLAGYAYSEPVEENKEISQAYAPSQVYPRPSSSPSPIPTPAPEASTTPPTLVPPPQADAQGEEVIIEEDDYDEYDDGYDEDFDEDYIDGQESDQTQD